MYVSNFCDMLVVHPSKVWPCLTLLNKAERDNYITREATSLARVLISHVCQNIIIIIINYPFLLEA